ncbi:MAG TPA: CPBP family glutamic-type intramembrane protease [Ktedonobacterales bacterium]
MWLVVGLGAPYTLLNTLFPGPALTYALGMILALIAVGVLILAGVTRRELFLHFTLPSPRGALLLVLLLVFIPGALLAGRGQPLDALADLIYAPASAISQELYFRSALLVAFAHLLSGRNVDAARLAPTVQAAIFALWHLRAFEVTPPLAALAVLLLAFVAGLVWGTEAQRDRTLIWCALEHTLFLIVQ